MQFSLSLTLSFKLFEQKCDATSLILDELLFLTLNNCLILSKELFHFLLAIQKVVSNLAVCLDLTLLVLDLLLFLRS